MSLDFFNSAGFKTGRLLVATPGLTDTNFLRSVIYVCAHTPQGAMGIVLNNKIGMVPYETLLKQLGLEVSEDNDLQKNIQMHFGGPVDITRGFVLHSADYFAKETFLVNGQVALSTTLEIVKDLAEGAGPQKSLFAMGYAGWGAGQLDKEIAGNSWLDVEADDDIIFGTSHNNKWEKALKKLGIQPSLLSSDAGLA